MECVDEVAYGQRDGSADRDGKCECPAPTPGYAPIPPPRAEVVPPPPRPTVIWEPGHWHWNGYRYIWISGRYIERRPQYGHYVPGAWVFRHGTWMWVPAHWG